MFKHKLAFVIPWFGLTIPGGAESHCREFVTQLNRRGYPTEVLTTCVKEFASNWNRNFHKPGVAVENGITVRRFPARQGKHEIFNSLNSRLLRGERLSDAEELAFMTESVNSDELNRFLREHQAEYFYFFMPYMFGTTFWGSQSVPGRAVLIPCLHDEPYAGMNIMQRMFGQVKGIIFNSPAEQDLANRLYDLSRVQTGLLGEGVETGFHPRPDAVDVPRPFLLYVGRKDSTKNVDLLIRYFEAYRRYRCADLKLVLVGNGSVPLPDGCTDLGFVESDIKHSLMAAAFVLCQPSLNESFSKVVMEAWLCGTPVLVHAGCAVTSDHARRSQAGLCFSDYHEFEACVDYLGENPEVAGKMGELGRDYVLQNYTWDRVIDRFEGWFRLVSQSAGQG